MFLRSFFGKSKEKSLTLGKLSEIIGAELPRALTEAPCAVPC